MSLNLVCFKKINLFTWISTTTKIRDFLVLDIFKEITSKGDFGFQFGYDSCLTARFLLGFTTTVYTVYSRLFNIFI